MTLTRTAKTTAMVLAFMLCVSTQSVNAEPDSQRGQRRGPPPEAIDACDGQAEDASCRFAGRRGDDVEGTCISPPGYEDTLVCAPEGGPPHHRSR